MSQPYNFSRVCGILPAFERGTSLAAPEGSVIPKLLNGPLTFYWFGGIILAATAILLVYFLSVQNPKNGLRSWGRLGLILSVLLILTTNAFMGFTRERARKPYLIYGSVYGNQLLTDMMKKMVAGNEEPAVVLLPPAGMLKRGS